MSWSFWCFTLRTYRSLWRGKKNGDILIVSITDNPFVNKGPDRLLFDSNIRAKSLLALQTVDFVIISKAYDCVNTLKEIKPNFFVKDIEYLSKKHQATIKLN